MNVAFNSGYVSHTAADVAAFKPPPADHRYSCNISTSTIGDALHDIRNQTFLASKAKMTDHIRADML
jgi:hypothetical protein